MILPTVAGFFVFRRAGLTGTTGGATTVPVVEGGADVRAFPQE
jgi:hypothetical protein